MKWVLIISGLLAVAAIVVVRTVGHDPAHWHVDPATVTQETLVPRNQYIGFAAFDMADVELAKHVETFIATQPNTTLLAGSMEEGLATYVVKTPVIGFPDYVSVRVNDLMGSAQLSVYSRSRFGYSDLGANRARVQA